MTDYDTPLCYNTLAEQLTNQLRIDRNKTITHLQKAVFYPTIGASPYDNWMEQGSDFFSHWLDPSLSFYSGQFLEDQPDNLFLSQKNLHRYIIRLFSCFHVAHILQVDCQWGGFISDCMCHGFDITAQTTSEDHASFCHNQVKSQKPKVNFLLTQKPVASLPETYDAIVDLESLNQIPVRRWPSQLNAYAHKLKTGGLIFLQLIVSAKPQDYLDIPKKHHAPLSLIQQWAKNQGHTILQTRNNTLDYIQTYSHWIKNLERERKTLLMQTPHVTKWGVFLAFMKAELANEHTQLLQILIQKNHP